MELETVKRGCDQPTYIPPVETIPGWMQKEELNWLFEQAKTHWTIVEVGSWFGRSTHALLSGTPGDVWAVDHFQGSFNELDGEHKYAVEHGDVKQRFLSYVGHFPWLHVVEAESTEAAKKFEDGSLDMVFIDATHIFTYVLADLRAWAPKLHVGGMLCGHDWTWSDVVTAVVKFFGRKVYPVAGTIWAMVKTEDGWKELCDPS